ncbi:prenylated flavin chaperone LpdD [Konateibacter massiliensis]|uniref:prenylated flavin chaperone LpdD n=1 Tax=Konateibacter massiliensis TaxID=2002841 RepID=UPI000C148691|nr:hypothetical protein [Konateibacter massiliensis]
MKQYIVKKEIYGHKVEAIITKMPKDVHILLIGGELAHTGAVSVFKNGDEEVYTELRGHKEGSISSKWAKELSALFLCRVTVVCGIHYDNATKEMIQEIVKRTDEMLLEVKQNYSLAFQPE